MQGVESPLTAARRIPHLERGRAGRAGAEGCAALSRCPTCARCLQGHRRASYYPGESQLLCFVLLCLLKQEGIELDLRKTDLKSARILWLRKQIRSQPENPEGPLGHRLLHSRYSLPGSLEMLSELTIKK